MENKKIRWEKPDLIVIGNAGYTLGADCPSGATAQPGICHSGGIASLDCTPGVTPNTGGPPPSCNPTGIGLGTPPPCPYGGNG